MKKILPIIFLSFPLTFFLFAPQLSSCSSGLNYNFTFDGQKQLVFENKTSCAISFSVKRLSSNSANPSSLNITVTDSTDVSINSFVWSGNKIFATIQLINPPIAKEYQFGLNFSYSVVASDKTYDENVHLSGFSILYKSPKAEGSIIFDETKDQKTKVIHTKSSIEQDHYVKFIFWLSEDFAFSPMINVKFDPHQQFLDNFVFVSGSNRVVDKETKSFDILLRFSDESKITTNIVEISKLTFTCTNDGRVYTLNPSTILQVQLLD